MIHLGPIATVLVILAVAGVLLYLLNALVPMDPKFKTAINALVGLVLFLYLVRVIFGFTF